MSRVTRMNVSWFVLAVYQFWKGISAGPALKYFTWFIGAGGSHDMWMKHFTFINESSHTYERIISYHTCIYTYVYVYTYVYIHTHKNCYVIIAYIYIYMHLSHKYFLILIHESVASDVRICRFAYVHEMFIFQQKYTQGDGSSNCVR